MRSFGWAAAGEDSRHCTREKVEVEFEDPQGSLRLRFHLCEIV